MGKVDCGFKGERERERERERVGKGVWGYVCVMIERMSGWE